MGSEEGVCEQRAGPRRRRGREPGRSRRGPVGRRGTKLEGNRGVGALGAL